MSLVSKGFGTKQTVLVRGMGKAYFVVDPDTPKLPIRRSGGGRVTFDRTVLKTKTIIVQDKGEPLEVNAIFLNPEDFENIEVIASFLEIDNYEVKFVEEVVLLDDDY